jgi:phenylacetate-CoA ligase
MDLSALYPREQCSCGSWLRKMAPFAGRADNMVKLRGVNVWPEAVGAIALDVAGKEADWFVRAVREDNRDALIVSVTSSDERAEHTRLKSAIETRLKDRLGVGITAEVVEPGALDAWTGVGTSPKLKRFRDDR